MNAYSTYTIKFQGKDDDIKKVLPVIEEQLEYEVEGVPTEIQIEEEYNLVWLEDITSDLAVKMAKTAPDLAFTIEGVVDTSESAGEYMDFSISYCNGKLTEASSCWYVMLYMDDYDEYEDFCEEYCDDEGNPLYSEEKYEELKEEYDLFVLDSGDGDIVTNVPLDNIRVIKI
mgnify:CR=1 FL=1